MKLHCWIHTTVVLLVSIAMTLAAHAQTGNETGTGILHGHIADQTGAVIPQAEITITPVHGKAVAHVQADAAGEFEAKGLTPGDYIVDVTYAGFAPFTSKPISIAAGQSKRIDVEMAIEVTAQNVVVSDDTPEVSIEGGSNASSVVIKGDALNALSDDPDELSNELSALAGPSAGPNGGQIYIDGFTGGQLPPKSAIREIRINQNPFSAEYDRLGYGRIEILTKPGTDKLHGRVFIMGNTSGLNTGNPFAKNIPPYYRVMYNGSVSGSLSKKSSFSFSIFERNNQDQNVYVYTPAVLNSTTNQYELGTQTSGTLSNPHTMINLTPRVDVQLGANNTLTLRYQYFHNSEKGDISTQDLPTQSVNALTDEHTFQLSDSQIINDHIVNETRLEYRRGKSSQSPVSTDPTVQVSGDFTGGGAASQTFNSHSDHLELQNLTTMSVGTHAIKFGAWLRDNRDATSTFANQNGTIALLQNNYIAALNTLASGGNLNSIGTYNAQTCAQSQTNCTGISSLTIAAGRNNYAANIFDGALYFQDDWRVNPRLTFSYGLRWETQNHINDHNDWAPRVALAYALDGGGKSKKPAKTVLRAGYGFFYDRMEVGSLLSAQEQGLDSGRVTVTTTDPSCLNGTSFTNIDFSGCLPSTFTPDSTTTTVRIAQNYHAPVTEQLGASIERQVSKSVTATVTYLHSFGLHQQVTVDANPYEAQSGTTYYNSSTGPRLNPSLGIIRQYTSAAVFKQNQMILNVNARLSPRFSLFGFYSLSYANSNGAGGTASNAYNLDQDYGPASFVFRHMSFMMGNIQAPWGIRVNPFLILHSGRPYNITTGSDLTGDNFFNNRPALADASLCTSGNTGSVQQYYSTKFGCLNINPQPGDTLISANQGTSPSSLEVNLRLSRSFGIGPKVESGGANGEFHGGGRGHGGPGGGFGPGGFGGGGGGPRGMFGGGNTRKYSLDFSISAMNIVNKINLGTPVGNVTASTFGQSLSLAGGPFSSGSASRRIFMNASFSF
ncbi:MAG: carboxypeptidase regulatory-like domain-containing protein [Acidobacteriota bacterium]|nr:carboxypeptidase regulatory-like domain-containing protein [Acidobacteriota bacterium]